MPVRVIAFLLAIVLVWSGLSTIESPRVFAQPGPGHSLAIAQAETPASKPEGSVEQHHLDDLPSQAQNDPPVDPAVDSAGLPPAVPKPDLAPRVASLPRADAVAEARPPYLAGPLRPPCSVAHAG
jgi:hypothetical protein